MRDICAIATCDRPRKSRGWCETHYYRWYRNGSPHLPTPTERFWMGIERVPSGCWEWTGRRDKANGYGQFGKYWAHRFSYELLVEPIPDGLVIDHLCMNPPCVNPSHLEPVTQRENVQRAWLVYRSDHCPHGHEFTPENTYTSKRGYRKCRECARIRRRRKQRQENWGDRCHAQVCDRPLDGDGVPCCVPEASAETWALS